MKRKPVMSPNNVARRVSVIERLQEQLKLGTKIVKNSKENGVEVLSDKDKTRIERELTILKTRV